MPSTIFTRIAQHLEPAHIVWEDDSVVAFLDSHPHTPRHTLVIPRREVDQWIDLDDDTASHLIQVAKRVGAALVETYQARRAGLVIAGYHVPHVHLHVFPSTGLADFDFSYLPPAADDDALHVEAEKIRAVLLRHP